MANPLFARDPSLPSPAYCVTRRAWQALFSGRHPMATSAVLDFLFKPSPSFIAEALVPMLSVLPAWTRPGPRIGVHLRTFELDKRR